MHASAYRNPEPYRGRDVLVVSAGNTGSEISLELVRGGASRVRTAMRSAPNIVSRWIGRVPGPYLATGISGLPIPAIDWLGSGSQRLSYGDLSAFGIPEPTFGLGTNVLERSVAPMVDDGFVDAVKAGEVEIVGAVESFDGAEVILAGGERIGPEAVIAATGYRRALEALVAHLEVLLPDGRPAHNGRPGPPGAPGLWFVGYRTLIRGALPLMKRDARHVARDVARWISRNR
jgi:putative flavoprotein involved in K+ transport